jgi:hypothetical protein
VRFTRSSKRSMAVVTACSAVNGEGAVAGDRSSARGVARRRGKGGAGGSGKHMAATDRPLPLPG